MNEGNANPVEMENNRNEQPQNEAFAPQVDENNPDLPNQPETENQQPKENEQVANAIASGFCSIFLLVLNGVMNLVMFTSIADKEETIVIVYGEFVGCSIIFNLPSFLISCFKDFKKARIVAVISFCIVIIGMIVILLGIILMTTTMEEKGDGVAIIMCGIFCEVVFIIRIVFLYSMYFTKSGSCCIGTGGSGYDGGGDGGNYDFSGGSDGGFDGGFDGGCDGGGD